MLDVGGSFPGINADAFDVYAEAKMYNALRWYEAGELNADTRLFGSLPELDSMAVLEVLLALEQRFGITIEGEDVTVEAFESAKPVITCTEPSGWNRTVALSQPPTAYRTAPRMREGASPHISL